MDDKEKLVDDIKDAIIFNRYCESIDTAIKLLQDSKKCYEKPLEVDNATRAAIVLIDSARKIVVKKERFI